MIVKLENVALALDFGMFYSPNRESRIADDHNKRNDRSSYVCIYKDQIVGALVIGRSKSGLTISSYGTIVRPSNRKEGIALDLWVTMLKAERPKRVAVKVISDRGYSLIGSLNKLFPKIKWNIDVDANRPLRKISYR